MLALEADLDRIHIPSIGDNSFTIPEKNLTSFEIKKRINLEGFVEIFNNDANAFIEVTVYNAVSALNKVNVITSSSGFHSHFSKKFNGLTPCWCIICEGLIPNKIKKIANTIGFIVRERFPIQGTRLFPFTEIYLPSKVASQKKIKLAKELFDSFANQIMDRILKN